MCYNVFTTNSQSGGIVICTHSTKVNPQKKDGNPMKKNIAMLLAGIVVASTMAVSAFAAAEPTILWDFTKDEVMSDVMTGASSVSYVGLTEDGVECYAFTAEGADPYVYIETPADSVDDVVWCKARVKNPTYSTAIELFGATNGRSLTGSECTHIDVKSEDDAWYTYLIYIPTENIRTVNAYKDEKYAITDFYWEGNVDRIRLDPLWREGDDGNDAGGNMEGGEVIYIDYVAFFATQEDAFAFRADQDNYAFADQAPVVETEPETVAVPDAEVVDVVETVTTAPQTFDMGIVAAIAATVSAAGYMISKKR